MYSQGSLSDAVALRDLARRVVMENVSSDGMQRYIQDLMELELVELPAVCRQEARVFRCCQLHLSPSYTAELLLQRAAGLEGKP